MIENKIYKINNKKSKKKEIFCDIFPFYTMVIKTAHGGNFT